jgi:hypothetical protein
MPTEHDRVEREGYDGIDLTSQYQSSLTPSVVWHLARHARKCSHRKREA